ncbi:spermine synthase [Dorcoceras hygrometricum]|uniref:Spermine synthase n=1 Tax=Dorcoceras hygrometricum TaxID=472368 RepID=A0A2Z7D113_9LAMI|nr:spermine synthase [Dorcoceras hygrometricum]
MGDFSISNGLSNEGCMNVNGNGNAMRKSCWYEEEIEENLRWCFALKRSLAVSGHSTIGYQAIRKGSTAREILRHKTVEKVIMCDIDQEVVDFCKSYLVVNKEAFYDPRLELVINDARAELERREEVYDVIIGDLADPIEGGPCYQLYTKSFYEFVIKPRLSKGGIFVTQAGPAGIFSHTEVFTCIFNTLSRVFKYVVPYSAHIPSYADTWGWVMASDYPFTLTADELDLRIKQRIQGENRYLDGKTFISSSTLCKAVRKSSDIFKLKPNQLEMEPFKWVGVGATTTGTVKPNSSADERSPRRGPRGRRASGIGECVRIPTTNEHSSKGAGDMSGEDPPSLSQPSSVDSRACGKASVKIPISELYARIPSSELYARLLIAFALDDVDERMGKAELLRAMQEAAAALPKKSTKRKAPSLVEKEARGEKRKKAGASTSGPRTEETPKQKQAPTPPTPTSEEPLDSPSAIVATGYICNMAPDRDRRPLRKARNADVVGHFSTNLAVAVAWGGELVKRLTQTYQKLNASREQFDRAMGQHAEMLSRLEELEVHIAREEGEAKAQREALEAQLAAEKEAHEAEKAARTLLEDELEEVKARAGQEAERLKIESREEFLKSPEFDTLLGKKAGGFFKNGFRGCLAQWCANGYSEEEHPASFLDVQQVILEMADEEEEGEEEEGDGTDATPPNSPPPDLSFSPCLYFVFS